MVALVGVEISGLFGAGFAAVALVHLVMTQFFFPPTSQFLGVWGVCLCTMLRASAHLFALVGTSVMCHLNYVDVGRRHLYMGHGYIPLLTSLPVVAWSTGLCIVRKFVVSICGGSTRARVR